MKKLALIVFGILICQTSIGQNLKIRVTNKTGFDIDSLTVSNKYIGLLRKDTSIFVELTEIAMISGNIMGFPKANIKGRKQHPPIWDCSTKMKTIVSGNYNFDVVMKEDESGYWLFYNASH